MSETVQVQTVVSAKPAIDNSALLEEWFGLVKVYGEAFPSNKSKFFAAAKLSGQEAAYRRRYKKETGFKP